MTNNRSEKRRIMNVEHVWSRIEEDKQKKPF